MIYAFSKIRIIISGYVDMCRLGAEKSTSDLAARFRSAGFDLARQSIHQMALFMPTGAIRWSVVSDEPK